MNLLSEFIESDLAKIVRNMATAFDINPELLACIILQESGGEPWLNRYEHGFYLKYVQNKTRSTLLGHVPKELPNLATEKQNRSTSWGLMQVMGQTARELGFQWDEMPRLLIPLINVHFGCKYIVRCFNGRTVEQMLLKYNGGGNPNYPHEVLGRLDAKEYVKILK
jgi:hypothetical protein